MSYLLDTNVVSEVRKPTGDPHVRAWIESVPETSIYLSVLVIGEIRRGAERLRRRDPAQAAVFDLWIGTLRSTFADRTLPITPEIAEAWGRLNAPDPLPAIDGLLAATALVHGLTLVTRNTSDVARTGVQLFNPFSSGQP
jgi:toxin FitB